MTTPTEIGLDGYPTDPNHPFNFMRVARTPEDAVELLLEIFNEGMDQYERAAVLDLLHEIESDGRTTPRGWSWAGAPVHPARYLAAMRTLPPAALSELVARLPYAPPGGGGLEPPEE